MALTWGPAAESTGNQVCTCHNLSAFASAVGQFHLSLPPTCREVYSGSMKCDYSYQSRNQLIPPSLNPQPDFHSPGMAGICADSHTYHLYPRGQRIFTHLLPGEADSTDESMLGQNPAGYTAPLSHYYHHQDPDTR